MTINSVFTVSLVPNNFVSTNNKTNLISNLEQVNDRHFSKMIDGLKQAVERKEEFVLFINDANINLSVNDIKETFREIKKLKKDFLAIHATSKDNVISVEENIHLFSSFDSIPAFILRTSIYKPLIQEQSAERLDAMCFVLILNSIASTKISWERTLHSKTEIENHRINIIIPFRNVNSYLEECLTSIISQKYSNFRVFLVDDCSENDHCSYIPQQPNIFYYKNSIRKFALANIVDMLIKPDHSFRENDIIMLVDGDDLLEHEHVLQLINHHYNNSTCQMTFGSFRELDTFCFYCFSYTREEFSRLRTTTWKGCHLRTFKYKLFQQYIELDPEMNHLKNKNGQYYEMTYDIALLFPLMELCSFDKIQYISHILYRYRLHENNDHSINRALQKSTELEIRNKHPIKIDR